MKYLVVNFIVLFMGLKLYALTPKIKIIYPDKEEKVFVLSKEELNVKLKTKIWKCSSIIVSNNKVSNKNLDKYIFSLSCNYNDGVVAITKTCITSINNNFKAVNKIPATLYIGLSEAKTIHEIALYCE